MIGLATQVRRHATQEGTQPVWAPPGSHPPAAVLGESPSGVPPSVWTPETDDPPEQGSCRLRPPCGNNASTDVSPTQATTRRIATCEGTRLPENQQELQPRRPASPRAVEVHPTSLPPRPR